MGSEASNRCARRECSELHLNERVAITSEEGIEGAWVEMQIFMKASCLFCLHVLCPWDARGRWWNRSSHTHSLDRRLTDETRAPTRRPLPTGYTAETRCFTATTTSPFLSVRFMIFLKLKTGAIKTCNKIREAGNALDRSDRTFFFMEKVRSSSFVLCYSRPVTERGAHASWIPAS